MCLSIGDMRSNCVGHIAYGDFQLEETMRDFPIYFTHVRSITSHAHALGSSLWGDLDVQPDEQNLYEQNYSQLRLISLRLIEHSRIVTDFLGTGRPHSKQ